MPKSTPKRKASSPTRSTKVARSARAAKRSARINSSARSKRRSQQCSSSDDEEVINISSGDQPSAKKIKKEPNLSESEGDNELVKRVNNATIVEGASSAVKSSNSKIRRSKKDKVFIKDDSADESQNDHSAHSAAVRKAAKRLAELTRPKDVRFQSRHFESHEVAESDNNSDISMNSANSMGNNNDDRSTINDFILDNDQPLAYASDDNANVHHGNNRNDKSRHQGAHHKSHRNGEPFVSRYITTLLRSPIYLVEGKSKKTTYLSDEEDKESMSEDKPVSHMKVNANHNNRQVTRSRPSADARVTRSKSKSKALTSKALMDQHVPILPNGHANIAVNALGQIITALIIEEAAVNALTLQSGSNANTVMSALDQTSTAQIAEGVIANIQNLANPTANALGQMITTQVVEVAAVNPQPLQAGESAKPAVNLLGQVITAKYCLTDNCLCYQVFITLFVAPSYPMHPALPLPLLICKWTAQFGLFANFPPAPKDSWNFVTNGAGGANSAQSTLSTFLCENSFDGKAVHNIIIGGVTSCSLIQRQTIEGTKGSSYMKRICIQPLQGELELLARSLGNIFSLRSVELVFFRHAISIGTKGVRKTGNEDEADGMSSGTFAGGANWTYGNKSGNNTSTAKLPSNQKYKTWCLFATSNVPIYDGTMLSFDWDTVENLPRINEDLHINSVVAVVHTISKFNENRISFNVQFVVKLA
ncbi:hypothetical protein M422DRAFT_270379 [Sphaerobolus stellatus SS14]|uniref:Uncharacterized protein n=1 Tax=Sphaerobolus stellatus (strain SS14) TaxID=990650 RepID=A0A0C9TG55_SPHS4|nr:hypothetical protein M422DRAFT_270379 [Sphaerobolus stellatus SS14]